MRQCIENVKIGNNRSTEFADVSQPGCRPQAQLDAVLKWHETNPSAWWCSNPFEIQRDGRSFNCSFLHTYFDIEGTLQSIWITPTGRIKEISKADDEYKGRFKKETDEVIGLFGAFEGK